MDYGLEAQKAAEAHLAACQEVFWELEEGEMTGEESSSPASAPFCNCDTCIVREVLFAAWPIMERSVLEPMTLPLYSLDTLPRSTPPADAVPATIPQGQ